jgi:hypothetical protein
MVVKAKSKQKTIRLSTEHPIQARILELADSGVPVKLRDGRYVMATDFLRELLVVGYQHVDDSEFFPEKPKVEAKKPEKKVTEKFDSMTDPI